MNRIFENCVFVLKFEALDKSRIEEINNLESIVLQELDEFNIDEARETIEDIKDLVVEPCPLVMKLETMLGNTQALLDSELERRYENHNR